MKECSRQLSQEARRPALAGGRCAMWLAMGTALLLGTPSITWAQDTEPKATPAEPIPAPPPAPKEEFPDRFMIRGGYNYVFNADTTFAINGASGIGTSIDFARNLSGQREDSLWRIDSLYRFNPRHSVGFSYYNVTRKGDRVLNADVTIDDVTYAAGGQLRSELGIQLYRFMYNYSFHHDERVELGASLGLYFADIDAAFQSNLTCAGGTPCGPAAISGGQTSNLVAPLPTIGFFVNYNFTPRLMGQARFDWFYFESDQFKGSMDEIYLGLDYRLFKYFSLGAAFNRLDVDLKNKPDKASGWRIENDWNTVYLYGAVYF